MKKRTLPFGYEVRSGVICECEPEAKVVCWLFSSYADGKSFKELALSLQAEGVPYQNGDASWNKNKVARIINSTVYLGTEVYPPLIGGELYDRAMEKKPACVMTEESSRVKAVWQISRCACCGGRIRMASGNNGWNRWCCTDCDQISPCAVTERIMTNLRGIWHDLVTGECDITAPVRENAPDALLTDAEKAFDALLDEDGFDEKAAMSAAMKLTARRYDSVSSADYETERIRYILRKAASDTEMDVDLLRAVSSVILIYPDGSAGVRLANGQVMQRNEVT